MKYVGLIINTPHGLRRVVSHESVRERFRAEGGREVKFWAVLDDGARMELSSIVHSAQLVMPMPPVEV